MYIAIVGAILTIIKIATGPTISIDTRNKLIVDFVMQQGIQQLLVNMVNMLSVLYVVIMVTKPNIVHLSNVLAMKGAPNQ
jgi:hypothetical protein